jgi:hypothetical protein
LFCQNEYTGAMRSVVVVQRQGTGLQIAGSWVWTLAYV